MHNKIALTLTTLLACFELAFAQDSPGIRDELARLPFDVDFTAFSASTPDTINLEVYYKIYSSALSFKKFGAKFKADYSVDIKISLKGKQVTGLTNDGNLIADDYEASISKDDYVINKVAFRLSPDNYELTASLRDPEAGEIAKAKDIDIKLRDFARKLPYLSGIEFIREATAADGDSQFVRGNLRLIPSVSRLYGEDDPEMDLYFEVYNNNDFRGDYLTTYEINNGEKTLRADTSLFPSDGAVTPCLGRIKVDNLLPGEYKIVIQVKSPGNNVDLKAESDFLIGWSAMGLVRNDYKTAIEQLRYIATRDQMKQLTRATEDDRIKLWNEYWKSKDPTPSTPENELKDEYYKRVRYADLNFGNFGRDGWKTDMGMVFITFGPPDEIERHPFDLDAKPYQIWFYYAQKRTFRFVDVNGYGEFELLYPYDGDTRKLR